MRKSLALILSIAMVFSMFSSLAFAADADLTTQQKYDALADKGIFAGMADGSAGLDQNMTRAQFARVSALILNLDGIGAADTKVVTEKPFSDVNLGLWYTEEIAAAKEAGVFVGNADGTFNPNGDISVQELAVVAAGLLGLDPVADATVEGAADWAAGYIKALIDNGVDFPTNYTEPAVRADLASLAYTAAEHFNVVAPDKVSVASASATGVSEVTVVLDKAVDTDKATVSLKRGTGTVATTTTWSEDKKTATLKLTSTKIADADYTVTLGGITAEEIANPTATFKGAAETVTKIEFVTTSDEIASSDKARVKVRADNQYGELASFSTSSYTVTADALYGATLRKDSEGYLVITLDTKHSTGVTPGLTMIPLYIYFNDTHVTATKTFKLGFEPFVTKMELGELKYDNAKTSLESNGDTATAQITIYDQYGNPISVSQGVAFTFNKNLAPYTQNIDTEIEDFDNDDEYEVRVALTKKEEKATSYTVTVYAGSASGTATFEVTSSKVPNKVQIESYDGTIATGDKKKYVSLNVTDANGVQLTNQEIADSASSIAVNATGILGTAKIVTVGPNKGKILLPEINQPAKGFVFVTASILTPNANSFDNLQIPVADARVATSLAVDTKPAVKAVLGADSEFKVKVKDQYGDDVGTTASTTHKVYMELTTGTSGIKITDGADVLTANGGTTSTNFDAIKDGMKFDTTAGAYGSASLKLILQTTAGADLSNPVTVSIESIDPTKVTLNYSLEAVANLYAALDSGLIDKTSGSTQDDAPTSSVAKQIKLVVKDNANNTVAYPDSVESVSTSNSNVAVVDVASAKGFVLGNKAGEATINAVVGTATGETKHLSTTVTVKSDLVAADSITANGDKDLTSPVTTVGDYVYSDKYMNLKIKDQYGIEYSASELNDYDKLVGVRYSVSEVVGATVTINSTTGEITAFSAAGSYQFVVTASTPNGKTVSTVIFN